MSIFLHPNHNTGTHSVPYLAYMGDHAGCNSGKTNCNGAQFPWSEIDVDEDFQVPIMIGMDEVVFTKSHVEAYYDNIYETNGFLQAGPVDFSTNCHGYAFDLECWVDAGIYGIGMYLDIGPEESQSCFIESDELTAELALKSLDHSSKVMGGTCTFVYMCEEYGMNMIVERNEKEGEGPIYVKSGCSSPVLWTPPYYGWWTLIKAR